MQSEIHWLLHFCHDNTLLTDVQIAGFVSNLDPSANLESFMQELTNTGWIPDTEYLKSAGEAAIKNTSDGFEAPPIPGFGMDVSQPKSKLEDVEFPDFQALETLKDDDLRIAVVDLFETCKKIGASDLHLSAGGRPRIRHHRRIVYLGDMPLSDALARRMNLLFLNESQLEIIKKEWDLDYALSLGQIDDGSKARFRAHLMEQKDGLAASYRIIPDSTFNLEELGFHNADTIRSLLDYHNGIILVTGPTGCGKTTTLASLISELNQNRREHIITVEDPIEVIQQSENSIVTQRQVGKHTKSFHTALSSALREDPDVIVIGEMRDLETIEMAVTAAETGHLVIATMHTGDAAATLNRMLDVFPPVQQNQIRAMTAGSLRGIVCQKLLPSVDDEVVLACELLINTPAVANIIRDGKETGLENAMQTGSSRGMLTMRDSVLSLFNQGRITEETAKECLGLREDEELNK